MKKKTLLLFALALVAIVSYAQTPATDNNEVMERKDTPTTQVDGMWWVFNGEKGTAYFAYKCNRGLAGRGDNSFNKTIPFAHVRF